MKNLRRNFERFCYRNRNKGIPNLMLYIVFGCGVVSVLSLLGYSSLYELLRFDKNLILQGQVWRLVTYIFTMSGGNILMTLIVLYCTYSLGRAVEYNWGTLKFNLYYLVGIVLMDVYAMIFDGSTLVYDFSAGAGALIPSGIMGYYSAYMMFFLHLSLVLCYATMYPEAQFVIFFIIPIKARFMSLIYLGFTLFEVVRLTVPIVYLPHNLFPLVALLNYFLFFGSDIVNLLPTSWRVKRKRPQSSHPTSPARGEPIPFRSKKVDSSKQNYSHRCTVCGRTDVSDPQLEFRYCSRCNGYHCYCEDHISNHIHIE